MSVDGSLPEKDPEILKQAMTRGLRRRSSGNGEIVWPAVPSMLDRYIEWLGVIFASLGRGFSAAETDDLRSKVKRHLEAAFAISPHSRISIKYHTEPPPDTSISYTISHNARSMADEYAHWIETRTPPLFGAHADAKVMNLAEDLGGPGKVAVLDIGAGTGRNTLPLAGQGYVVDAVEMSPDFAQMLRSEILKRGLSVNVFEGDAFDHRLGVPAGSYDLIVAAEVVSHFRSIEQVRTLFHRAAEWLKPGGVLLFSAFIWDGDEVPSFVSDMSEVMWSRAFSLSEIADAGNGTSLMRMANESVHDFERDNLEPEAWPPTGWFADWARGLDVLELPPERSPLQLRWLTYKRIA